MTQQPETSTDLFGLAVRLGILSQLFQSRVATLLEPTGISYNQLALLSHLARSGEPQTIGALAEALEVNQPGVTKLVQRLEAAGLVTVVSGTEDRRRKLVAIEPAGLEALGGSVEALQPDITAWFESWNTDELADFDQLVDRLVGWLDDNRIG